MLTIYHRVHIYSPCIPHTELDFLWSRLNVLSNTLPTAHKKLQPLLLQPLAGNIRLRAREQPRGSCVRDVERLTQIHWPCINHWKVMRGKAKPSKLLLARLQVNTHEVKNGKRQSMRQPVWCYAFIKLFMYRFNDLQVWLASHWLSCLTQNLLAR